MSSNPKYVFDTNTLISAALFKNRNPRRTFRKALKSGTVFLSKETFKEIENVIRDLKKEIVSFIKDTNLAFLEVG